MGFSLEINLGFSMCFWFLPAWSGVEISWWHEWYMNIETGLEMYKVLF